MRGCRRQPLIVPSEAKDPYSGFIIALWWRAMNSV